MNDRDDTRPRKTVVLLSKEEVATADWLWGNPAHQDSYLPNRTDRLKKYAEGKRKMQALGIMR